jgi:hypothetical protein
LAGDDITEAADLLKIGDTKYVQKKMADKIKDTTCGQNFFEYFENSDAFETIV